MYTALKKTAQKKDKMNFGTGRTAPDSTYNSTAKMDYSDMSIRYHAENRAPVVQMIRKRVKGRGACKGEDIFYDKEDGCYYNRMTPEERGEVTVSRAEYGNYLKLSSNNKERTGNTVILAKADQDGKIKYAGVLAAVPPSPSSAPGADISVTADIYTEGAEMPAPPKAVRLYAEGNMKHAASLARAFQAPGKYSLFEGLDEGTTLGDADTEIPEVLIKATELDTLEGLGGRYTPKNRFQWVNPMIAADEIATRAEQPENLEASFGGSTGNMTRPDDHPAERPRRRYDIIQATFFWIPGDTDANNFGNLKAFMLNQSVKLNPGGKIRIVLSGKNSGMDHGNINKNNYMQVAGWLVGDPKLKEIYIIKLKNVPPAYSDKLTALGMNTEKFQHTRTEVDETVDSGGRDLLIEAVLQPPKPSPKSQPDPFVYAPGKAGSV